MAETPGPGTGAPSGEYGQQHRRLTEQVLDRAASDPQWKQRLLDDPQAATAEFPEAQRLRETYESVAPEAMPAPQEEYRRLQRSQWEKMLDRAASDPAWKQRLLDDPEAAMREADFPETRQLEQMRAGAGEGEVRGQALPGGGSAVGGAIGDAAGAGGMPCHFTWICYRNSQAHYRW